MRKQALTKEFRFGRNYIEVGYYDNRTNYAGSTFGHTNIRLGPFRWFAKFDDIPLHRYPEREKKVNIGLSLPGLHDIGFEIRWSWLSRNRKPKIGSRYYDPIEGKSKIVDDEYLKRDWDFVRDEDSGTIIKAPRRR